MKIGIDFGGVIANHLPTKISLARQQFGLDVHTPAEVTRAVLQPILGAERYADLVFAVGGETLQFPLFEGVKKVMEVLVAQGDTFHIVSTQTNATEGVIQQYVTEHGLPVASVAVVTADMGKLVAANRAGVELFIDDSTSVLRSLTPLHIPRVLAAFSSDYHLASLPDGVLCIRKWDDFLQNVRPLFAQ